MINVSTEKKTYTKSNSISKLEACTIKLFIKVTEVPFHIICIFIKNA